MKIGMEDAFRYLVSSGNLPEHVAAGIVGNLWVESGLRPDAVGDRGASYGLAQWQGPRRRALEQFAAEKGKDISDPFVQLDFILHEFQTSEKSAAERVLAAKDAEEAARVFALAYERPGQPMLEARVNAAKRALGQAPGRFVIGPLKSLVKPTFDFLAGVATIPEDFTSWIANLITGEDLWPHPMSDAIRAITPVPEELSKEAGFGERLYREIFDIAGQIVPYALDAVAIGRLSTARRLINQAASVVKSQRPRTLLETFLHILTNFVTTDYALAKGRKGEVDAGDVAHSVANAALFSLAHWAPTQAIQSIGRKTAELFGREAGEPMAYRIYRLTQMGLTGGAFAGSAAIAGERDPWELAHSFLVGLGLNAVLGGGAAERRRFMREYALANGLTPSDVNAIRVVMNMRRPPHDLREVEEHHPVGEEGVGFDFDSYSRAVRERVGRELPFGEEHIRELEGVGYRFDPTLTQEESFWRAWKVAEEHGFSAVLPLAGENIYGFYHQAYDVVGLSRSGLADPGWVLRHETFHLELQRGNPAAVRLYGLVNKESREFAEMADSWRSWYPAEGLGLRGEHFIDFVAEEVAANYAAGEYEYRRFFADPDLADRLVEEIHSRTDSATRYLRWASEKDGGTYSGNGEAVRSALRATMGVLDREFLETPEFETARQRAKQNWQDLVPVLGEDFVEHDGVLLASERTIRAMFLKAADPTDRLVHGLLKYINAPDIPLNELFSRLRRGEPELAEYFGDPDVAAKILRLVRGRKDPAKLAADMMGLDELAVRKGLDALEGATFDPEYAESLDFKRQMETLQSIGYSEVVPLASLRGKVRHEEGGLLFGDPLGLNEVIEEGLKPGETRTRRLRRPHISAVIDSIKSMTGLAGDPVAKSILEEAFARVRFGRVKHEARLYKWYEGFRDDPIERQFEMAALYERRGLSKTIPREYLRFFEAYGRISEKLYKELNDIVGRLVHLNILPSKYEQSFRHVDNYFRHLYGNYGDEGVRRNLQAFIRGSPYYDHLEGKVMIREVTKEGVRYRESLGGGSAAGDVEAAMEAAKKAVGGARGFLKRRYLPTWEDAMRVGLKPKYDLFGTAMADIVNKLRFIHEMEAWASMVSAGHIRFFREGRQPAGWVPIEDPTIARVVVPTVRELPPETESPYQMVLPSGETVPIAMRGRVLRAYAPKPIAVVWNNYLSVGLTGRPWYDFIRYYYDIARTMGVSFSTFHAKLMLNNYLDYGIGHHLVSAIGSIFEGNLSSAKRHLRELAETATGVKAVRGYREAKELMEHVYGARRSRAMQELFDDMMLAGADVPSPRVVGQLARSMASGFRDALRELGEGRLAESANRVAQAVSKPIMEWIVPVAKTISFIEKRKQVIEEWTRHWEGKEETPEVKKQDYIRRLRDARIMIDRFYGQLAYENYHMNRGFRDGLFFIMKYPGWNIGSFSWVVDNFRGAANWVRSLAGGEGPTWLQRESLKYTVGLITKTFLLNYLVYSLIHQSLPDDPIELITKGIWTGGYNPDGSKQYVRDADYLRDLVGVIKEPVRTVVSKTPDFFVAPYEILKNEDYFGARVLTPDQPERWPLEIATRIGKVFVPYSVQQAFRGRGALGKLGGFTGLTLTPTHLSRTPAEAVISEYYRAHAQRGLTPLQREQLQQRMEILDLARQGDLQEFEHALRDGLMEGTLTKRQVQDLREKAKDMKLYRFRRMPLEKCLEAYRVASPVEKELFRPALIRKYRTAAPETKRRFAEQFQEAIQE